jgi:hypothetical protein
MSTKARKIYLTHFWGSSVEGPQKGTFKNF